MLRKTILILATATALSAGFAGDSFARGGGGGGGHFSGGGFGGGMGGGHFGGGHFGGHFGNRVHGFGFAPGFSADDGWQGSYCGYDGYYNQYPDNNWCQ